MVSAGVHPLRTPFLGAFLYTAEQLLFTNINHLFMET